MASSDTANRLVRPLVRCFTLEPHRMFGLGSFVFFFFLFSPNANIAQGWETT
jgi:hypothetical protein